MFFPNLYSAAKRSVKVFPNPTSGIFTVEIPGPGPELNIKVTDPIGKKNWKGRSSAPKQYIDLSEKPSGIYFVNVLSGTTKSVAEIVLE